MTVNQIYGIVNSVAMQMYGDKAVQITDVAGLISLGDSIMSSATDKDNFLNTLVDRIGRTIISQRAYSVQVSGLINDAFTFGAIMQKIYIDPIQASQSQQWNLTQGGTVDQYIIAKPTVKQKLFKTRNTWAVTITIPDFQLSSAFTSATEMAAFIDAIFLSMRNSMEIYLEGMAEMCYANMIGERIVHTQLNNGHTVIDLLAMYNSLMQTALSTSAAMMNTEFLKFASITINLFVKRMGKMSSIYNSEGYKRFTPQDKMRVTMLADFTSAVTSYLQSNTYHDELVALPKYTEVAYWQGIGAGQSGFDNTGTVAIRTSDGYTVMQQHVICMLSDEEAIGLTYDNRRSKSAYNASGEYTNFFEKADMGYFNDLSENAVVFTVGALAVPTLSQIATTQYTYSKAAAGNIVVPLTLNGTDAYSKVNVAGTALTVAQATYEAPNLTILNAYLADQTVGSTVIFNVELTSNAIMQFYITISD